MRGKQGRLKPVFLGIDVGIGPLGDTPGPESRTDLTGIPDYTDEQLDPVIPFSRNESDYDEFCREENRTARTFYVFEPATGLNYVCVASRDGLWVAVPGRAGLTNEEVRKAFDWNSVWAPSRVAGKTRLTRELRQGERREVYLER